MKPKPGVLRSRAFVMRCFFGFNGCVAVSFISNDRKPQMRQVDAYLIGSAGVWLDLQERCPIRESFDNVKARRRRKSRWINGPRSFLARRCGDWFFANKIVLVGMPVNMCEVSLFDSATGELLLQWARVLVASRKDHDSRCCGVEPVG